jgi:hypothetical protein
MEHPKLFERLQWLRNGDHCLRIKQEPLQFRPGHTTAKIEQPVEINGSSTSTKVGDGAKPAGHCQQGTARSSQSAPPPKVASLTHQLSLALKDQKLRGKVINRLPQALLESLDGRTISDCV